MNLHIAVHLLLDFIRTIIFLFNFHSLVIFDYNSVCPFRYLAIFIAFRYLAIFIAFRYLAIFIDRMFIVGYWVVIGWVLSEWSVILRLFAFITLEGVELVDCLLGGNVDELIEFDRDKTLFAVNLNGVCCLPYTNRTGRFSILLSLFLKPGF